MTGMKSLLARASSGSKKDLQAAQAANQANGTGNGSSHGTGKSMIPDDTRSPPSKRAATQEAVKESKLYATTTREEVPPRAVPSVRDGVGQWGVGYSIDGGMGCICMYVQHDRGIDQWSLIGSDESIGRYMT